MADSKLLKWVILECCGYKTYIFLIQDIKKTFKIAFKLGMCSLPFIIQVEKSLIFYFVKIFFFTIFSSPFRKLGYF